MTGGMIRHSWKGDFERATWNKLQAHHREIKRRRDERERVEDRVDGEIGALAVSTVVATEAEIAAFRVKLDRYETATVEALIENDRQLTLVRERITDLLGRAHVLEDDRRVFKTEDGERVFDEHGDELSPEIVDPAAIADHRPTWETYSDALDRRDALEAERTELIEFQERLDEARERLDDEGLTTDDLDELGADLEAAMPAPIRSIIDPAKAMRAHSLGSVNRSSPVSTPEVAPI